MKNLTQIILLLVAFANFAFSQTEVKLVLPVGHTDAVTSAQFSPDGKYVVTASEDKTAKIWDVASGKMLQDLTGHTDYLRSAQFSTDGKYIVTASRDGTAKIWDVASGKMLQDLTGHTESVLSAQFSPDGKTIVTASWDNTAKKWDVTSGKILHDLIGHSNTIFSAKYSPDGKYIVTTSVDQTAKIWDVASGKMLQDLTGHTWDVRSAQFSPDGKYIVTASEDETAKIWDVTTGKMLKDLVGHTDWVRSAQFSPDGKSIVTASDDKTAKIWDVASGEMLKDLVGNTDDVISAQFSPDGKYIVTASDDKTAKIWDVASGKMLQDLTGHTDYLRSAQFSPDGKYIVTASGDETAKIWDVASGKMLQDLRGQTMVVPSAQFSPDGKSIVTASSGAAKIWDVALGKILQDLIGHTGSVRSAQFSHDGRAIITASDDQTAKIWDVASGKMLQDLSGHTESVRSAQFSPDGKYVVTASEDKTAKIWDVASGEMLKDLTGHTSWVNSAHFSPNGKYIVTASVDQTAKIWDVASGKMFQDLTGNAWPVLSAQFSPDGKYIVTASWDKTPKIWDMASGEMLQDLKGHTMVVPSAQFSPDGKTIVTASWDNTAKIWDVTSGKILYDLIGHLNTIFSAEYSPDGKYIVTTSEDKTAKIWDVASGKLLKDLTGHVNDVNSAQFSPDGKTIITMGIGHKTIIWDAETGKMLYTRLQLTNNDWLVYDEHYRYDGSEGAREYLYFTCGLEIIDLAQMKDALYVPGLVEKIMNGQDINYPKLSELEICGALPLVEKVERGDGHYHYRITPRRLPLEYTEVYVNGKMVLNIPNDRLRKERDGFVLTLAAPEVTKHFVVGQPNEVKVVGIVKQNGSILRSRGAVMAFERVAESIVRPSLYALMVGVNDYKDPQLQLRFPAKDSRDLGNALELSATKLLGSDRVFMYYVNSEVKGANGFSTPEKEGIRKALEDIGKKAKPEDVVLIFFAGHGVMQGDGEKVFTFLTAEASNYNKVGITTKDLQSWLSYEGPHKMLANKTILIFDACNSGQATQELLAMARSDDDTRRIRQVEDLKDKSGMFILAASAPNQNAYELPQLEQGLLTYSLLHTLKNNPEVLDDSRFLNIQKWFLESEKYLQQVVKSLGYNQDAQPFGTANIRIGEVDETVKSSIRLASQKPIVICANVLNTLTFSDDLQLKGLINQSLADISERGVDNPIFFARQETPNANSINILYQIDGETITCQVRLVKGSEQLHQTVVNGTKSDINELVKKIIDEVVRYAK
jgi:WD40 repeat protein